MEMQSSQATAAAPVSPRLHALFMVYLRWYMPRHFHALRIAHADRFPASPSPLIVCINHPSWWDPLTILMLSKYLAPTSFAYAPMESEALAHYGFFRRLGAFPVDNASPRAAAQFLRQAKNILARPNSILWMTPEGRFTDVRQPSITWKPGTAALTRHLGVCTVLPIAIEYTFWDERLPEILCMAGKPIEFFATDKSTTQQRNALLKQSMSALQAELCVRAQQRDASLFSPIFSGSSGINAGYNLWQRFKARTQGKAYVAEHSLISPK